MNRHETILRMIEEVDPLDLAKLEEIDARVWCWIKGYLYGPHGNYNGHTFEFQYEKSQKLCSRRFGLEEDELYTCSRDALKAIRPEGWWFEVWQYPDGWRAALAKGQVRFCALKQKTECLAELHVIIQVIAFERSTLETTRNKED